VPAAAAAGLAGFVGFGGDANWHTHSHTHMRTQDRRLRFMRFYLRTQSHSQPLTCSHIKSAAKRERNSQAF